MKKDFRAFLDLLDDPVEKEHIIKERQTMSDSNLAYNYWVSTTTIVNYLWPPPKKNLRTSKKYKYIDVDKAIWMRKEWYSDVEIATELWCANSTINKRLGNRWDGYKSWNKFKKYVAQPPDPYKNNNTIIEQKPQIWEWEIIEIGTWPFKWFYDKLAKSI